MQFVRGMIVRSKKGHDKGRFYVVLRQDGDCAALADAKSRTEACPKMKKLLHLAPTKTVLTEAQLHSDSEIQNILAKFSGRAALPKEVI